MITFDRQLRELNEFDPRGAGVLSLYLSTDPLEVDADAVEEEVSRIAAALRSGLEPSQREALDEEFAAVRDYLGSMLAPPVGLALFSCSPRHFFRIVRLPVGVTPSAYWAKWAHVAALEEGVARAAELEHGAALV